MGIGYRELPGRNVVIVLDSNGPNNIYKRRKDYDYYLGYKLECYLPGGGTYGSNMRLLTPREEKRSMPTGTIRLHGVFGATQLKK